MTFFILLKLIDFILFTEFTGERPVSFATLAASLISVTISIALVKIEIRIFNFK